MAAGAAKPIKLGAGGTVSPGGGQVQTRPAALLFLSFVVVFIIYGSLFPFDFRNTPESFASLFDHANFFGNIADATDNFFLFIPLGIALYTSFRSTRARMIATLLSMLLLGFGLQLLQLYLPSRTASVSDVFWNGLGILAGLLTAGAMRQWFGMRLAARANLSFFPCLLVGLWFCYESFPFIPTLDYELLRGHIKTVIIAPPFETMRFIQHLLAAVLAGIALQRIQPSAASGWTPALVGSLAVLLEILVPYGSLRRETLLGIAVGLTAGHLLARRGDKPTLSAIAAVSIGAYLISVFTPYRGQIADGGFTWTPFANFLWHNVMRDLPPLAFEALAIGALLWAGSFKGSGFAHRPFLWSGLIFLAISLMETIRVLVLGYHGDTTPLLLAALLGTFSATFRPTAATTENHATAPSRSSPENHCPGGQSRWPNGRTHAFSILLLAFTLYLVSYLPGMPYNVRELFPSGIGGIVAALCLASAIYLAVNATFYLLAQKTQRRWLAYPLLLPLQGIAIWMMLRLGVPMESIHDIIGAPVLDWPWEWELLLRFLALHQAIATQIVGAVLLVATICRPSWFAAFVYWLIVSLLCAWPLHLVIVDWAATDNLTELIRDHAAFSSSSLLAAGSFFTFLGGSAFGAALACPAPRYRLLLATLLAAPLAAACCVAGLEPVIVKYGKAFSALQFLLSPDRAHYLAQSELMVRFALAYLLCAGLIAILQLRAWKGTSMSAESRK